MEHNPFIRLLLKLKIINPNKKFAEQLRKPHGQLANYVGQQMNLGNRGLNEFVQKNITNGDTILEIGYGNGHFYKEIFEKYPDVKISGIDLSKAMYTEAIATNAGFIANGMLNLHCGSSDALPFADNSFDKIFCVNVVYFWQKPEEHLKEILRVLKPNGKFFAGIRTKETMQQMPFTQYGFAMYTPDEWETVVKQNGFKNTSFIPNTEIEVGFDGTETELHSACVWGEK
jgi:ubiquinone/menaquinone biosynthesis C-methylase UbiE